MSAHKIVKAREALEFYRANADDDIRETIKEHASLSIPEQLELLLHMSIHMTSHINHFLQVAGISDTNTIEQELRDKDSGKTH